MKKFLRALCLVVVAACGRSHGTECSSTSSHFELHRIDEDSGPSKDLSAKAGFDHGGLHADIDVWTSEPDATRHLDFYVTAPDRAALAQFVVQNGSPSADHEWLYGEGHTGWRTYYAQKQVLLDQSDVASVKQIDRKILEVTLTDAGRPKFAAATRASIGHKLAIVIDGNVVVAPIINGAIEGGRLQISLDANGSADAIVKKLCR